MAAPVGILAALMGGAPLELPKLSCALCLAIVQNDTSTHPGGPLTDDVFVNAGKTIAAGWLVCEFHAEVLAHQLAAANYRTSGLHPIRRDGTKRPLADYFTLPPAVTA